MMFIKIIITNIQNIVFTSEKQGEYILMSYEEFADKMSKGAYSKMTAEEKLQYIFDTEEGMFVPIMRWKDYNWLNRNFLINNKNHPLADEVMKLLKDILKK